MTRRGRGLRSALAFALAGLATVGLVSACAAPRQQVLHPARHSIVYAALGDSYASGYGVPPYRTACGRSEAAYAVQLAGREKVSLDHFVACAGATTSTLVSGHQLDALAADTDLVTLTIGGNDTRWGAVVAACLGGTDRDCAAAITAARARVTNALPGLLDNVYGQVAARAPHAHVLVTGYPRLFTPRAGALAGASPTEQQALNHGADQLNRVIAAAARRHGFGFVDVTKRFVGHGANATDPWITGPLDPAPFHPNAHGYQAYTAAVAAAVRPGDLT